MNALVDYMVNAPAVGPESAGSNPAGSLKWEYVAKQLVYLLLVIPFLLGECSDGSTLLTSDERRFDSVAGRS